MDRFARVLAACLVAGLLGGCASGGARWAPAAGTHAATAKDFRVELPEGWMWLEAGDALVATRDGVLLQRIAVERLAVGKPLETTKKALAAGMQPAEAAEVVLDELASKPGVNGLAILENEPATLDGRPGFRAVYRFTTSGGLLVKGVYYGVLTEGYLYGISYRAPERHYFDIDLQTFERLRESFRLTRGA